MTQLRTSTKNIYKKMNTLQKRIAQYKYDRENTKEFWGSLACVIGIAILTYMWFSFAI
jgi:hypothetical protein